MVLLDIALPRLSGLEDHWDLVVSDYSVPGMDFRATLQCIHATDAGLPVILFSGSLGGVPDHVHSLIGPAAQAKGLVVTTDPDRVPVWLRGDPTPLLPTRPTPPLTPPPIVH